MKSNLYIMEYKIADEKLVEWCWDDTEELAIEWLKEQHKGLREELDIEIIRTTCVGTAWHESEIKPLIK